MAAAIRGYAREMNRGADPLNSPSRCRSRKDELFCAATEFTRRTERYRVKLFSRRGGFKGRKGMTCMICLFQDKVGVRL